KLAQIDAQPGCRRNRFGYNCAGANRDKVVHQLQRVAAAQWPCLDDRICVAGHDRFDPGNGFRIPAEKGIELAFFSLPRSAPQWGIDHGAAALAEALPMRRVEFGSAVVESTKIMPGRRPSSNPPGSNTIASTSTEDGRQANTTSDARANSVADFAS